jgi:hypothetical protein
MTQASAPTESTRCREQATRCALKAATARSEDSRDAFLSLSKQWEVLAAEFDRIDGINRSS